MKNVKSTRPLATAVILLASAVCAVCTGCARTVRHTSYMAVPEGARYVRVRLDISGCQGSAEVDFVETASLDTSGTTAEAIMTGDR